MKRFIIRSMASAMLFVAGACLATAQTTPEKPAQPTPQPPPAKPAPSPTNAAKEPPKAEGAPADSAPVNPETAPKLELSSTTIDFGEVWQGTPVSGEVTIKNVGKSPLKIISVKASCGCTTPTKPKDSLEPGESDKLTVGYDTLKRKGAAHQTVTITTNDPTQPSAILTVQGNVKALYEMKPQDGIFFANVFQDTASTQTVKITNMYTEKMNLKLPENQKFDPFEISLKEVEPGMVYELTASTKPPMKEGNAYVDVQLQTGVEKAPTISVRVNAFVMPPVQVRPSKLIVPPSLPKAQEKTITITFPPDKPIKVLSAKADLEDIKVEIKPDSPNPAGQKNIATVTIAVTIPAGDAMPPGGAKIEITTDSSDPKYAKITVPVEVVKTNVTNPPLVPAPPPTPAPVGTPNTGSTPPTGVTPPKPSTPPTAPKNADEKKPEGAKEPSKP
jgi:hypothetical protein